MNYEKVDYNQYPCVAKFFNENTLSKSLMEGTLKWLTSIYIGDFSRYQNKTDNNTCVYFYFNHVNEGVVSVIGRKGHVTIRFAILDGMNLRGSKKPKQYKGRRKHPEGEVSENHRVTFTIKTFDDLRDVAEFLRLNRYWNFHIEKEHKPIATSEYIEPNVLIKTIVDITKQYELNPKNGNGFVYAIKNRINPNIIKIGMTTISVLKRMNEIKLAGAYPYDFECIAFIEVDKSYQSEQHIHKKLDKFRLEKSEWFSIADEQAIEALASLERTTKR
ncbi:GIY-YIG nuclease family protein [Shewanella sp. FJAT-52076]|uniref:GIY-YIG nuclease family protein n=1 Tax=Shewanella sp. FJAT-52076 TaxID=2864202 RepID=UPI001C66087B|nr:GIY-YIG nuclease family protein [Shewanella sp. FJAT-52076]QYJ74872.1 GIY-YIG nuclease family protein [Shewanella sp. FJAT-52076]